MQVLEGDVYKNQKVNKNCNVVVIGGGTAGLEAACTAAEVGCNTFLLEKGETLGGLASVISKIPAKKRLADFPNYLIHRAEQLENLYIFTNTEGTPENIRKFHPNLIVSSTGSAPLLPPIRGLHDRIDKEGSKVASILGMINHINDYPEDMTGKKFVVVGGGAFGLDVVEFFAARNAVVNSPDRRKKWCGTCGAYDQVRMELADIFRCSLCVCKDIKILKLLCSMDQIVREISQTLLCRNL